MYIQVAVKTKVQALSTASMEFTLSWDAPRLDAKSQLRHHSQYLWVTSVVFPCQPDFAHYRWYTREHGRDGNAAISFVYYSIDSIISLLKRHNYIQNCYPCAPFVAGLGDCHRSSNY